MPPSGAGQQGQGENHMAPMWIMLGVFTLLIIVWLVFKVQIVTGYFEVKLAEMRFLSLFTNSFQGTQHWVRTAHPNLVTMDDMLRIADQVGNYLRIPVAVICIILAIILYRRSVVHRFNRIYSMSDLLESENAIWPQTTPVVGLDLLKEDIDKGPWAMGLTPMQFAKRYKLLKVEAAEHVEGTLAHHNAPKVSLLKQRASEVLVKQLGPIFQGVDTLNGYTKALLAVFMARVCDDADGALHALREMSASAKHKHIDFSATDALLKKYRDNKLVKKVMSKHAYVLTMMSEMLALARTTGVLANSDFLWLKIIDRRLWYMLSSTGRQTPYVEVAAPFAHWLVEKALDHAVTTPMIDEAVNALDQAIKMVIYKEDDEDE
jgi:intracellular multiplication protein IcmP